ncbi:coiled-coil domain-containing protein 9 isoform X2 [Candoia aspera]|uniref:coiled-coil domain-containing protein 9 isoform X2 n=1 Tax=Candoia aspera TaxID=51853 RepID=UPI002FD86A9B
MSASLDLKSREEKDAELDKRIEALRRKNQALIKRYQEIEEDRRKAEREGVAVTGARRTRPAEAPAQPERRRAEAEAARLAGQVPSAPEDTRVLGRERKPATRGSRGGAPPGGRPLRADAGREGTGADSSGGGPRGRGGRGRRPRGRGGPAGEPGPDRRSQEWEERRRRNIEKMNEEMEKIAEYERGQRDGLQEKNPVRNFLDDPRRSGPFSEVNRREGSRRHIRNWGGADFDKVKTGLEQGKEQASLGRGSGRHRGLTTLDMTLSMTGRERAEYTRWKQERDQIDRERLARHRQPTGEWRREWDAEKTDPALKGGHEPGGSPGDKQERPQRPPKRPTFGEFLSGPPGDRHWKIRGCGRPRGRSSGPYSMHDNRWEREEPDQTPLAPAGEDKAGVAPVLQAKPQVATAAEEEEEEDEWEDVSGEEEEEEEVEANGSRDSSLEEDRPPPSCSLLPPGEPGQLSTVPTASPQEAPGMGGVPLTPLGPSEGYQPVSDWGEEMEMRSPRASSISSHQNPLDAPTEELPAGAAGKGQMWAIGSGWLLRQRGEGHISSHVAAQSCCLSSLLAGVDPPVLLAMHGSLPVEPPAGGAASPAHRAQEAEIKMDSEVPGPKEVAG